MVCERILLRLVTFRRGKVDPVGICCNHFLTRRNASSLTAAKEKGESIVINGKPVALGIPGGAGGDQSKPVPGIPLGRAATPEEAANSVL